MADPETKPEPVIPVQEQATTPITVATEAPIETEAPAAEPAAPAAAAEPAAEDKVKGLPDWAQKAIRDNAFEAREAKREAKRLADELAKRPAPAPAPAPAASTDDEAAARANAPAGGYRTQADFDAAVQAETNKRDMQGRVQANARDFNAGLDKIWNTGVELFKDQFDTVADNLNAAGVLPVPTQGGAYENDAFMRLVMATDNPAAVLHAYGSDPQKAIDLMKLTPERRAIEVAKMDVTVGEKAKKPPAVSKVPAPVDIVDGSRQVSDEPRDSDNDDAWFAKRQKQVAARRG